MQLIRFALAILALFLPATAQAEWRRAESPSFIVYSDGSEARLRERVLLLEDFDRLLRTLTTYEEPPTAAKLHVYLVDNQRALTQIRDLGRNVGGFYSASAEGIAAFVSVAGGSGNLNEILFHEYAHHFMLQHARAAYPSWYIEGFAEYFSTVRFTRDAIDIGNYSANRAAWLVNHEWLPLDRILGGTPAGAMSGEATAMFYSQSWLLTHYFYSNPERQSALTRYLSAMRTTDPVSAIQVATGMNADRMGRELRNYIRGGSIAFRRMRRGSAEAPPPVTVTVLPRAADDLILYYAALRIGIRDAVEAAQLQAIRAAASRHPADPFARRVLAHAELLHGDRATAARLLDSLIAELPNDAELMYLRGRLHLESADEAEDPEAQVRLARQWFVRAHRADPNHFQTLYRYFEAVRNGPDRRTDNTANLILLAHQLAPQVTEVRFAAAALMLERGDAAQVVALLAPITSDPHDAQAAASARQMIAVARQLAAGGTPAPANADKPSD
ncbi:MAG: tetratricopeptide repeat protein [Allosphingosinicella sp.]|uniref:tetratricopeptide repeat protein n=1 Tax=Allosphingosinicella sp. TaxID=2823234 RepID=UPI0039615A24